MQSKVLAMTALTIIATVTAGSICTGNAADVNTKATGRLTPVTIFTLTTSRETVVTQNVNTTDDNTQDETVTKDTAELTLVNTAAVSPGGEGTLTPTATNARRITNETPTTLTIDTAATMTDDGGTRAGDVEGVKETDHTPTIIHTNFTGNNLGTGGGGLNGQTNQTPSG
jgi:hypothetical protein